MRELDDRSAPDVSVKKKICRFCESPAEVVITRTAERDSALLGITKLGILEGVLCHIQGARTVYADFMDNRDLAFILKDCAVEQTALYVKLKFSQSKERELMVIISSHPDRRW